MATLIMRVMPHCIGHHMLARLVPPSSPICSSLHLSLIRFHHRVHIRRQKIKSLDNMIYPYFVQQNYEPGALQTDLAKNLLRGQAVFPRVPLFLLRRLEAPVEVPCSLDPARPAAARKSWNNRHDPSRRLRLA